MNQRRNFLAILISGGFAMPLASFAQKQKYRIGYLANQQDPRTSSTSFQALVAALRELGWNEGENIEIRIRSGGGREEMFTYNAIEFVRENVDLIITTGTASTRAAKSATEKIPIVFASSADPVGQNFVTSFARPGGNLTGLAILVEELTPKRLQLLKEIVPRASRIARLYSGSNPQLAPRTMSHADAAASTLGLALQHMLVNEADEIETAMASAARSKVDAVIIEPDAVFIVNRVNLALSALKHRLPMMCTDGRYVEAGALVAYGEDFAARYRRAAYYVDKILRGAKPAEIPVELPNIFELTVNAKTAGLLGLTIPRPILLQASRVIS